MDRSDHGSPDGNHAPASEFRGEDPAATMSLFDSVAITNRGIYAPEPLFSRSLGDIHLFGNSSLRFDVSLDLLAILAVLFAGIWATRRIKRRADAVQEATGDRPPTWYFRLGVLVLPTVMLLFALGFYLGYSALKGFNFKGGIHMRNLLLAMWFALSFYAAAFIAEIVRAGIQAITTRSVRGDPRRFGGLVQGTIRGRGLAGADLLAGTAVDHHAPGAENFDPKHR